MHDPVGIDVEGDLDLRGAPGRRRQVHQLELAQGLVVHGHLPLALEHVDLHRRLVVVGGGEHFAPLGGDGGVPLDEAVHDAALGLDAQRQRGHVEEQYVLHLALQHTGLDGSTDGHHLVGVHAVVGLFADDGLDQLLYRGGAGGTAHQHHVVDVIRGQSRVGDGLVERSLARLDQILGQLVEGSPGEFHVEVLGPFGGGGDERQVDLGLLEGGQFDLGLLGCLLQALGGHLVGGQVDTLGVLEGLHQPVDDPLVPVVTTELRIARGGLDLADTVAVLEEGHVEGASTEVEHQHCLVGPFLVQAVGEGGGGRLIDDTQHFEAGDAAGFFGGSALGVVEVGRHGDDRLVHRVAQERLGVPLQLAQDTGGDLLGGVVLAVDVDGPRRPHVTLHRPDGPIGVGDGLALGHLAHQHFAGLGEADHRRGRPAAFGVGDDDRLAALQHAHHRVGGPEVNTHCFIHRVLLCSSVQRPSSGHLYRFCPSLTSILFGYRSKYNKVECYVYRFSSRFYSCVVGPSRDTLAPCPTWSSSATANRPGTPRISSPGGTMWISPPRGSPRPPRQGGCWEPKTASTCGCSTPRYSPGPYAPPT